MLKSLVALAILSAASSPALAQAAPAGPAAQPAPAAAPTVKKRVCEMIDEDPSSRLGKRRICRTIEVPAPASGGQGGQTAPTSSSERG